MCACSEGGGGGSCYKKPRHLKGGGSYHLLSLGTSKLLVWLPKLFIVVGWGFFVGGAFGLFVLSCFM